MAKVLKARLLFVALLALSASIALGVRYASAANDTWWIGKAAQEDTHYNYRIQHLDTNHGREFLMSIYLQKKDDAGRWVAPVFVQDQGNVLQGTLILGENLAPVKAAGSNVSSDLDPYINAYTASLGWLNAFSPQSNPKSLSDPDWGKLGCIGCSDLLRQGPQTVSVTAGTYDATIFGIHYGQSNSFFWISPDLPYPAKATLYAATIESNPPVQYAYELVEKGSGPAAVPKSELHPVTPPLQYATPDSRYQIRLNWSSIVIEPSNNVTFDISFFDNTGAPLNYLVNYNLNVTDSNGVTVKTVEDQTTDLKGTSHQSISFPRTGSFTIDVLINGVGNQPKQDFIENADFNIVVTPEFPAGAIIPVSILIGAVLVLVRMSTTRLGFQKFWN